MGKHKKERMVAITTSLLPDDYDKIKQIAITADRPEAYILRKIIVENIDKYIAKNKL